MFQLQRLTRVLGSRSSLLPYRNSGFFNQQRLNTGKGEADMERARAVDVSDATFSINEEHAHGGKAQKLITRQHTIFFLHLINAGAINAHPRPQPRHDAPDPFS
jgi:hypothetical protein